MKSKNALFAGLIAIISVFAPGCAPATDDIESTLDEEVGDVAEENEPSIDSVESPLNSSGQYCAGYCRTGRDWVQGGQTCWGGEYRYYFYLPNVTQDCRARVVDFCHNRNWGFGDAYWSYYVSNGYWCIR